VAVAGEEEAAAVATAVEEEKAALTVATAILKVVIVMAEAAEEVVKVDSEDVTTTDVTTVVGITVGGRFLAILPALAKHPAWSRIDFKESARPRIAYYFHKSRVANLS